jgi:hypothetical protein
MSMAVLGTIIASLLYPGLMTALAAGALFGLAARGRIGTPRGLAALRTREGLASMGGAALAGVGLATLPWPLHPAGGGAVWLWTWATFELAFLLPLLPALLTGAPAVTRAAIREAQLGALARAALWAALGAALTLHASWGGVALAAHVLAIAGVIAAYPAAIGWGPFGAEERVSPGGTGAGLPEATLALNRWAAEVRAGALLAATLVAALPVGALPPLVGLALVVGGLIIGGAVLRRFEGRVPRMTLPASVRFCLTLPLPLAVAASLALTIATRG